MPECLQLCPFGCSLPRRRCDRRHSLPGHDRRVGVSTRWTTTEHAPPERRAGPRAEVRHLLSNMVLPNIGAFIAWGLITALFIKTGWLLGQSSTGLQDPYGWVAKLGGWGGLDGRRHRRPDDHLPAAAADRLHRRPDDVRRQPRRRGRRDRDHGRRRRRRRADVPRRDGHGPARRLDDEEARRALGRQDPARLRDAGQQLLRRHLGHDPGRRRLLRHRPVRRGVHHGRRQRRRLPGRATTCCR